MKTQPDERLARLATAALGAMDAIDARREPLELVGTQLQIKLFVSPKGNKYITIVGETNGRPFAEVFGAVATDPSWDATIKALVEREA